MDNGKITWKIEKKILSVVHATDYGIFKFSFSLLLKQE